MDHKRRQGNFATLQCICAQIKTVLRYNQNIRLGGAALLIHRTIFDIYLLLSMAHTLTEQLLDSYEEVENCVSNWFRLKAENDELKDRKNVVNKSLASYRYTL